MFAKIFSQIFDSTIASNWKTRVVFQDFLLLADPDGVVDMPVESIVRRTGLPVEMVKEAIIVLEGPDPESRTPDHDGKRLLRLSDRPWGWMIVNYRKYREIASEFDRRSATRARVQHYRSKSPSQINSQQGYVYYALCLDHKEVKIGFSANPWTRIKELQTARPGIKIVATERATLALEKERHEEFKEYHLDGEWFRYSSELKTWVESLATTNSTATSQLRSSDVPSSSTSPSSCSSEKGFGEKPTWDLVKSWLADWRKNGADYTEKEAKAAFLACESGGWMWGKRITSDPRSHIERQINNDRDYKARFPNSEATGKSQAEQKTILQKDVERRAMQIKRLCQE